MSRILWSSALLPESTEAKILSYDIFDPALEIENVLAINKAEKDFEIPDKKALRLMSRSSVLLSAVLMRGQKLISEITVKDPFRVATYCAIENGSDNYKGVKNLLDVDEDEFAEKYRRSRSPKTYLKQLPNLAPAQAGIFLGLLGPLNVYQNSKWACLHALEQMEADFASGDIDAAVVCTSNSFEDALLTLRNSRLRQEGSVLTEGAGVMLITSEGSRQDWKQMMFSVPSKNDFGISTGLMTLINKQKGDTK